MKRKGMVREKAGLIVVGIIIALLVTVLFVVIHFKLISIGDTQISIVTSSAGITGMTMARAKKGSIPPNMLVIVIMLIAIFLVSFMLWNIVDENGQKIFVRTISNIGDAIGNAISGIIPGAG